MFVENKKVEEGQKILLSLSFLPFFITGFSGLVTAQDIFIFTVLGEQILVYMALVVLNVCLYQRL